MKSNEKILVYAVAGFLAVILVIAVLYGNDDLNPDLEDKQQVAATDPMDSMRDYLDGGGTANPTQDTGPAAGEPNDSTANAGGPASTVEPVVGSDNEGPSQAKPELGGRPADAVLDANPAYAGVANSGSAGSFPLSMRAEPVRTPADRIEEMFGASQKVKSFRIVTVKRGETLSDLVSRWCGSLDRLAEAERLNEGGALYAGDQVYLPWVEPTSLLAVHAASAPVTAVSDGGAPAPVTATAAVYQVVDGDNLWRIAEKRGVAMKDTPGWVKQVKELNPGVGDVLKIGASIQLPSN